MEEDQIPVSPAAHYMCGGIKVNEYGETSIPGLLAFGETACSGVHGANRLASNSTLECLAFTHLAVENIEYSGSEFPEYVSNKKQVSQYNDSNLFVGVQNEMWNSFGIERDYGKMCDSAKVLQSIKSNLEHNFKGNLFGVKIEALNLVTVGLLLARSAIARRESRGTHKLRDLPYRDDENWLKHVEIKEENVILVDH